MGANAFYFGNQFDTTDAAFTYQYAGVPWGSDHIPFITAGIPAVLAIQQDDVYYSMYHSSLDTEATGNYDQAMAIMFGFSSSLLLLLLIHTLRLCKGSRRPTQHLLRFPTAI